MDDADGRRRLIVALPRQQRAAVVLRYYLDLTVTDIAGHLGCTPATARSHVSHAVAALRRGFEPATTKD